MRVAHEQQVRHHQQQQQQQQHQVVALQSNDICQSNVTITPYYKSSCFQSLELSMFIRVIAILHTINLVIVYTTISS